MKKFVFIFVTLINSMLVFADTYPTHVLYNGDMKITYLLPDNNKGYYRSSKFDWGSMLAQIEYKDCSFLQDWRGYSGRPPVGNHDPLIPNTGTGLAEEFNDPQGYDDKTNNGYFVKIGVGLLKKDGDSEYDPAKYYDIIDAGERTLHFDNNSIQVIHSLKTDIGYHYILTREYKLEGNKLIVNHRLENKGKKVIKTRMFSHNFFQFNYRKTDSDMVLRFLNSKISIPENIEWVNKERMIFGHNELYVNHPLDDFKRCCGNLDLEPPIGNFTLFNSRTNMSVTVASSEPVVSIGLWFWQNAYCPEHWIMVEVLPEKDFSWSFEYSFIPIK